MDQLEPLDSKAIDKLFAKEPETLTDTEIDQLIHTIRLERKQFQLKAKKPKAKPAKAYKPASEALAVGLEDLEIDLGDLGTNK